MCRRPTTRSPQPAKSTTTPCSRPMKRSRRSVPSIPTTTRTRTKKLKPTTRTTRKLTTRTTIWSGKRPRTNSPGLTVLFVPALSLLSGPSFGIAHRGSRHVVERVAYLRRQHDVGFGQDPEQLRGGARADDRCRNTGAVAHPSQRDGQGRH